MDHLKCPKCNDGHAGADHFGEAMDCHYCDGTGRITAEMFVDLYDRFQELAGNSMLDEILLDELGYGQRSVSVVTTASGEPMTVYTRSRKQKGTA